MVSKSKKKALFFIQNGVGGAERVSIEIAKMLISSGWTIDWAVICRKHNTDTSRIESFMPKHNGVIKVENNGQLRFLSQLYKSIKKVKPDVVFASAMHINQRLLLISTLFPKTNFIVRNDNYLYTLPAYKKYILSITYKLADKIIAQTEEMEEELIKTGLPTSKVITLHNPLNAERILEASNEESPFPQDGKIKFVGVGRLADQKGYDILIKAFKNVHDVKPLSTLYIVGDTNYQNGEIYTKLQSMIDSLGIKDSVVFVGFDSNPYKYIKNADVYVLSSRYEGLPNTLIEAQFIGTSCAAVRCIPIIERIIKDGYNGYLAESQNSQSLSEAMLKALSLDNVKMTYNPASSEDFIKIFN